MKRTVNIFLLLIAAFSWGCAHAAATYPSYERAIAKYANIEGIEGVQGQAEQCDSEGCDCPRFWHYDRWVYHCDDHFFYWYQGSWYYYPYPHFYYFDGPRYYPAPRGRRITKE